MAIPRTANRISVLLALALAACVALAVPAAAQNPGADQYTPSVPGGDGPTPATDFGPAGGNGGNDGSSSSSGGDDGGAAAVPSSSSGGGSGPGAAAADGSGAGHKGGKHERDHKALDGIAAAAKQQRAAVDDGAASARLLRDEGGDKGLGVFFWVVIGLTLLWAIAMAVARRRRGGDNRNIATEGGLS